MPHPPIVVLCLLRDLIAPPHSLDVLVSAAPHLPYHEVPNKEKEPQFRFVYVSHGVFVVVRSLRI